MKKMNQEEIVQVQPVKLTQKLGRYTKGLMISIAIILLSTIIAVIGTLVDQEIIMIVGYVIVGLSSIIFFVFYVLFLSSIRRLARTNELYYKISNRIFVSFFYGFLFAVAGGSNSYSNVFYFQSQYYLSRIFGLTAILFFGFAFLYIDKLFKEFKANKLFPEKERRKLGTVFTIGFAFLIVLIDTILRAAIYASLKNQGRDRTWIYNHFQIPLDYSILAFMTLAIGSLCFFLYQLGNQWLKIEEELDEQYFKMGGKTFNDKFKSNILYISSVLMVSIFLSVIYVIYYFINYLTDQYIDELIWSIGIFLGVTVILTIIFIIRVSLNYNKMAQLIPKTSNYGIFTAIALSFSPFLLIAGFFSNIEFDVAGDLYLISRILLLLGIGLFAAGSFFNHLILKNLKLNKNEFPVRRKELILPISGLLIFVILVVDTIVRPILRNTLYEDNYLGLQAFNRDFLWLGYVFGTLFVAAIIPAVYGILTTSKEYLKVIPSYGKIPLRLRKSKLDEELRLYKPEPSKVTEQVTEYKPVPEKPEVVQYCSSCGKEMQERFNFCAFCGNKKDTKLKNCKNCGEVLLKGFVYCPICGTKK